MRRRTGLLLAVVMLACLVDAILLARWLWWEETDLGVHITILNLAERPDAPPRQYPGYIAYLDRWTVNGKVISDLATIVEPPPEKPEWDIHGFGRFSIIRMADNATFGDYLAATRSLASKGICRVIAFRGTRRQPEEYRGGPGLITTTYRDATGQTRKCDDRFNPPWGDR